MILFLSRLLQPENRSGVILFSLLSLSSMLIWHHDTNRTAGPCNLAFLTFAVITHDNEQPCGTTCCNLVELYDRFCFLPDTP